MKFQKPPEICVIHGPRLIVDDRVMCLRSKIIIQTLDVKDPISGGVALTDEIIAIGFYRYSKVGIFRWEKGAYQKPYK